MSAVATIPRHLRDFTSGEAVNYKPLEIAHPRVCNFLGNDNPPPLGNRTRPMRTWLIIQFERKAYGEMQLKIPSLLVYVVEYEGVVFPGGGDM